jgi:molybdenum cofactor cytidylyltransferase
MIVAERTAAIILAAGQSSRFGIENKLLQIVDDEPLIRRSVLLALSANLSSVVVVTGHDANIVEATLHDLPITKAHNPTPWAGMGTSLAVGINALPDGIDAAFIVLGDMPRLKLSTLDQLRHAFGENGRDIAVPVHDGRRGHPVLFAAGYFPKLAALDGDKGARQLLREHPERIEAVPINDPGTLLDIDTPEDLSRLSGPKLSIGGA